MLLARNAAWPNGMYSTLAGFVEPGESIEQTVHREVKEEVGAFDPAIDRITMLYLDALDGVSVYEACGRADFERLVEIFLKAVSG